MTTRILVALCAVLVLTRVDGVAAKHAAVPGKNGGSRCGDGIMEPGETCDDGNTEDGDACPSTCRIESCRPTDERFGVAVTIEHPKDASMGGVVVLVRYPEAAVSLPGSGGEPTVRERITDTPQGFMSSPFDLDYALRVVVASAKALPPGDLFHASFDRCDGVAAPDAKDFRCTVEQVAGPDGKTIPAAGFACAVKTL